MLRSGRRTAASAAEIVRGEGLSWARIAQELDGLFEPPGSRAGYPLGDWHASAAWRIARRHGVS